MGLPAPASSSAEQLESETLYRTLVETLRVGTIYCDREDTIVHVNSAMAKLIGYSVEDLLGRKVYQVLVTPDLQSRLRERTQRRLQGISEEYEFELVRKDGRHFWATINAAPMRSADGEIIGSLATITDVTLQKETMEALTRSEERFRRYFELPLVGFAVSSTDKRWLEVNDKLCSILGYPRQELTRMTWTELTYEEDLAADNALFDRVLRGELEGYSLDKRFVRKDGSIIYTSISARCVRGPAGSVDHFIVVIQDISERKHVEGELLYQRELFREVIDANPSLIFAKDREGKFILANKALTDLYGITPEKFLGKKLEEFNTNEDELLRFKAQDVAVIEQGQTLLIPEETVRDPRTGEMRYFHAIKKPLLFRDGTITHLLGVCTDITEHKQAEEENLLLQRQLVQSQKMEAIGKLAAGIAHDLNNALGAVVGHLQLLKTYPDLDGSLQRSVDVSLRGCERASSLIDQLLGFSRQGQYNLAKLSLQDGVKETINFLSRIVGKDISIETRGRMKDIFIHADRAQLQQVITNLVINAKHAMPSGGTITFHFAATHVSFPARFNPKAAPGNYAVLTVSDTGIGISPENLDKIFEPFFTTKDEGEGTGLGLSMAYGMLQNHGGWISAASEVGHGSAFKLYFPEAVSEQLAPEESQKAAFNARCTGTIVVVDDEPYLVELGKTFLERSGFNSVGFTRAKDFIAWYERNFDTVDLIVLDMKMPELDGKRCYDMVRKINPSAKVVVLSGYIHDDAAKEMLSRGAVKFFQKPLKYPELMQWISETLGNDQGNVVNQ